MKAYRIAKKKYLEDLNGEGARLYGGRWNKKGVSMLYFSESLSLSLLEVLVHLDFKFLSSDFRYLEVEIPDASILPRIQLSDLDKNWRNNPPISSTKEFGGDWVASQKSLAIKVPSAILTMQSNIIVNPKHKLISELKILRSGKLDIDSRVFK